MKNNFIKNYYIQENTIIFSLQISDFPFIQVGTWKLDSQEQVNASLTGCQKAKIQWIDCAYEYTNEKLIGNYLKKHQEYSPLITTKLWNSFHSPFMVQKQFQQSLENLGKIDIFVIHWPVAFKNVNQNMIEEQVADKCELYPRIDGIIQKSNCSLYETWRAMEQLVQQQKVKYIGVSNYCVGLLQDLLCYAQIKPFCNQIESNLYFQNSQVILYCIKHNVHICVYSPFGGTYDYGDNKQVKICDNEIVRKISEKHNISTFDVQLLWHKHRFDNVLTKEEKQFYHIIFRSQNENNINHNNQLSLQQENILDQEDLKQLLSLDSDIRFNNAGKVFWDAPVFD